MRSLTVVVGVVVLLVWAGTSRAAGERQNATGQCWVLVVNDWAEDRHVPATYRIRCYTEAIHQAPDDLRAYSSFVEDVSKARARAIALCVRRLGEVPGCGVDGNARTSPDFECWVRVLDDWTGDRRVRATHKVRCYTEALRLLPADLREHTTIVRDLRRARARGVERCERRRGAGARACQV